MHWVFQLTYEGTIFYDRSKMIRKTQIYIVFEELMLCECVVPTCCQ